MHARGKEHAEGVFAAYALTTQAHPSRPDCSKPSTGFELWALARIADDHGVECQETRYGIRELMLGTGPVYKTFTPSTGPYSFASSAHRSGAIHIWEQ
jgi:hypothetical protein